MAYKHVTATGLVYTGSNQIYTLTLNAGSDAATATLTDWTDTTGGITMWIIKAAATTSHTVTFDKPLVAHSGIYVTLAGTTPTLDVQCDGAFTTTSTSTSTTTTSTSTTTTSTSTSTS